MHDDKTMNEEKQIIIPDFTPQVGLTPIDNEMLGPTIISSMMRYRGTMFLVILLTTVVALPAIWFLIKPKYEVASMIHIAPFVRPILFSDPNVDVTRDYQQYMGTEAATVMSSAVLDSALSRPEIRVLSFVQDAIDPVLKLSRKMKAIHLNGTQLLKVSMLGEDPEDMELIINAVVENYLRRNNEKQRIWDEKILRSLRQEESELETKLEIKALQLQRTAVDHGLGGAEPAGVSLDVWMSELRQLLTKAKTEQAIASAKIEASGKAINLQTEKDNGPLLTSAEFENYVANQPELQRLKDQLRMAELAVLDDERLGHGPSHPDVQGRPKLIDALQKRIVAKKEQLAINYVATQKHSLLSNLSALEEEFNDARITVSVRSDELEKLKQQRSDVAGQLFVLENLRHERERLEGSLRIVKEKIWNVDVEQNRSQRITLESPAISPKLPNIDKRLKYAAAAFMFCFFSGMGAAVMRGRLDTSFHNPKEIVDCLGIRVLGSVEYVDQDIVTQTLDKRIAEPIRGISAALIASSPQNGARISLITSPTPGTGKSSLASSLSCSLAATGRNVLLIDADNIGQGVTRRMNMQEYPGLTDLLSNRVSPESLIRSTDTPNLSILPAGKRDIRFGEMLSSRQGQQRLASLFHSYDEVIFDSPPVLARSDAVLLASMVQEIILVLRAGHSTREETVAAQQYLSGVGGKVVGVILNAVDPKTAKYGYRYSYSEKYAEMKS